MNRSKTSTHTIHTVVLALTVPFLIVIPARAQETGGTKSNTGNAPAVTSDNKPATTADGGTAQAGTAEAPVKRKKIIFKPGVPLTINTTNETIRVTNDAKLAKDQVTNFPDSPEAHFVYAVALTRTSQVEEALKEVRNARKLASAKGGAAYFDSMITEYENMLENFPEDNQIRYHLAWAYYMKAYVLARYSKQATPKAPQTVAAKPATPAATGGTTPTADAPKAEAAPVAAAQPTDWKSDFVGQNSVLKPEELAEDADAGSNTPNASSNKVASAAKVSADKPASKEDQEKGYTNLGEEDEKKAFTPPTVAPTNATPHGGNNNFWSNPLGAISNIGPITGMEYAQANAAPEVIPQIKAYYRRSLKKLDEVLAKEPDDLWARLYRAHLGAEYSGDIDSAMKVWETCREAHPNNPAPYFFLGEGYLKKGDLKQCLTNVSKAIALRTVGN